MKIHKVTHDRIFFLTDTSAYGSVLKSDVAKLEIAMSIPEGKIDARTGSCLVESYVPPVIDDSVLISDLDYGDLMTKEKFENYTKAGFLDGTGYPSDGTRFWRCSMSDREYTHVMYFSK